MSSTLEVIELNEVELFRHIFWDLSQIQRIIYKYILVFSKNRLNVSPSQAYIAKKIGCCRKTVNRAFKLFEKLGWITKINRYYRTCKYIINKALLDLDPNDNDTFRREIAQISGQSSLHGKDIAQELNGILISKNDKEILSNKYDPEILQLAIKDLNAYPEMGNVRNIAAFLTSRCKEYAQISSQKHDNFPQQEPLKSEPSSTLNVPLDVPPKKKDIKISNVNVTGKRGESVQLSNKKPNPEPKPDIQKELAEIPISKSDKSILSKLNANTLRLAIKNYNAYKKVRCVRNISAFLTSCCKRYKAKFFRCEQEAKEQCPPKNQNFTANVSREVEEEIEKEISAFSNSQSQDNPKQKEANVQAEIQVPYELQSLPIKQQDKEILSNYSLQVIRLAIEDFKTYKAIKCVRNDAAFITSRCKECCLKLARGESLCPTDAEKKEVAKEKVDPDENKSFALEVEKKLQNRGAIRVTVEILNRYVELFDAHPGPCSQPICISYDELNFNRKLESGLRRWNVRI